MTKGAARRSPKQARGLRKIEQILDAAQSRLAREGLPGVTTTALAADCGMAVGSIYQYFASRDEILWVLYQRRMAAIADEIRAGLAALAPDTPREALIGHLLDHLLAAAVDEQAYVPLMRFAALARSGSGPRVPAADGPLGELMADILARIAADYDPRHLDIVRGVAATMALALVDLALCEDDLMRRGSILHELRLAVQAYFARFA